MIFNRSIKSGYFPDVGKTSHVIPIPKQNSAYSSPSSYRPISLLALVSKVFERHIFNWPFNFCQTNNVISPFQFGFRPSYSPESALIVSTTRWFKLLDQGYSVCSVFFDLKKAFDSVPHRPLIELLSKLNLPGNLLAWLQSYLTSRSQQVVVEGATSFKIPVISGVPQGFILGPLLFILYVNDIFQLPFSSSSSVILYADDILIFAPSNYHLTSQSSSLTSIPFPPRLG